MDKNITTQKRGLFRAPAGGNEWREIPKEKGEQQVLTDDQILKLSELILKIENHYGFPVDVEFARENNKFYIVQSRPITTLSTNKETTSEETFDISKLNPESYEYSWGASSVPFLFQSIFYHTMATFSFFDSFCISKDGKLKVYWSHEARTAASDYGAKLFVNFDSAKKYCLQIHKCADRMLRHNKLKKIDKPKLQKFITDAEAFLGSYIILDPEFTDDVLAAFNDSEVLKYLGEQKNELRERVNKLFFVKDSVYNHLLNLISQQTGIEREMLDSYSLEELYDLLEEQKQVAEVKERDFLIWAKGGGINYVLTRKTIDVVWVRFISSDNTDQVELIRGDSVAKKGIYKGYVKKLAMKYTKLSDEIKKLNQSDADFVLVTDYTTPELVPIMKKSLAIVTDMGGLLSHAAIIARELKKPCIIGTKIATQVLKDGDLVEVDAERGVVKIIKPA